MSVISVRDFNARGDGRTDDTAALQKALNAIAVEGGTLEIPFGVYLTGPLLVKRMEGQGTMSIVGAGSQVPLQIAGFAGTVLKYIGPAGGTVLTLYGINGGEFRAFNLDCNELANTGLQVECSVGAEYKSLTVTNAKDYGFVLKGSAAGVYRNVFTLLGSNNCAGGMVLTGTNSTVDVAENSFVRLDLNFRGPLNGLRLESADNNDFLGTSIVGTGKGLLLTLCPASDTMLGACYNRFHGLDGTQHFIVCETDKPNSIIGLSHGNGIPQVGGTKAKALQVLAEQ
jgi:hypothetical protein